mmetsp:Transcript_132466/g.264346  ORF Transcript_132466/g.264346 Transcript_132466/m.264346 type:complete len:661 (-) Transcript_132466:104-2086(-)
MLHSMHPIVSLRGYQRRICDEVQGRSALVVLPTGSGKTLVAAEAIRRHLEEGMTGEGKAPKVLFLVPACFLVQQQSACLQTWLGHNRVVAQHMGGLEFPRTAFNVLVSTPEAFRLAQLKWPELLAWESGLSMVVFDEVHHVLKDHPYRKLALSLQGNAVVVLGLSASLTYAVSEAKVKSAMTKLSFELGVKFIATATAEELELDGFRGGGSGLVAEVHTDLPITSWTHAEQEQTLPVDMRKPHLMHSSFWSRMRAGVSTAFAATLVRAVRSLEALAATSSSEFKSPLSQQKLASWGQYAHDQAKKGCNVCAQLQHWYEALRLTVLSWEEPQGRELGLMYLQMMKQHGHWQFDPLAVETNETKEFCHKYGLMVASDMTGIDALPEEELFPKWAHLWHELLRQRACRETRDNHLRAVVFVQQKLTAHILAHFLNQGLGGERIFSALPLHSTTTDAPTPLLDLSKAQADTNLHRFGAGEVDILVSTTVAEEGMDVPGANCVVRFDPVQTSVSFVQGRGRARQADSSFVILAEQQGRSAAQLAESESMQARIAGEFDPLAQTSEQILEREVQAQCSRERTASGVLSKQSSSALQDLNLFCKKTKVALAQRDFKSECGKLHACELKYRSILREVKSCGHAVRKEDAKKTAAALLLEALKGELIAK